MITDRSTKYSWRVILLLLLVTMASCGTTKKMVTHRPSYAKKMFYNPQALAKAYYSQPAPKLIEGKGSLTLKQPGETTHNSTIRWSLARDSAFVLSVRPLSVMEIARLTVTPEQLILLDRYHKVGYDLGAVLHASSFIMGVLGFDPHLIASAVYNDPASYNYKQSHTFEGMSFDFDESGYTCSSSHLGVKVVNRFDRDLNLTSIALYDKWKKAVWYISYKDFRVIEPGTRPYPTQMSLRIVTDKGPIELNVHLKDVHVGFGQPIDTVIPQRYDKKGFMDLVKLML